jgi:hypothetical protein
MPSKHAGSYANYNIIKLHTCMLVEARGGAVVEALRYKPIGSIPDGVIGIFHSHNPSGHTMALGSTQPLTEMSTRIISWG